MYKEYYMSKLSSTERIWCGAAAPVNPKSAYAKMCFRKATTNSIEALEQDDTKALYSNLMLLVYIYG